MVSSINGYLSGEERASSYRQNPDLEKLLIIERNQYMAESLQEVHKAHQHIVAIVGNAHVPGIYQHLKQKGISCHAIPLRQYFKEQVTISSLLDLNCTGIICYQFIALVFLIVLILTIIVQ